MNTKKPSKFRQVIVEIGQWAAILVVVVIAGSVVLALASSSGSNLPTSEGEAEQWEAPDDAGWSDGR